MSHSTYSDQHSPIEGAVEASTIALSYSISISFCRDVLSQSTIEYGKVNAVDEVSYFRSIFAFVCFF